MSSNQEGTYTNVHNDDIMRHEAEEDISRHREIIREEQRVIATSSRILNSLIPVAKLLPEILSEIFIHVAVDPFSYSRSTTSTPVSNNTPPVGPYGWIVITHVCHRWREVALKSPRLWSFIYLGPKEQVQEFLARSGQAPLRIRPWALPSHNDVIQSLNAWGASQSLRTLKASLFAFSLRQVLAEAHRIESLHLMLAGPVLERVFGEFDEDGFRAQHLRTLMFDSQGEQTFPKILSKCHLPALTRVTMKGYVVPWHLPFLRVESITSLVLHQTQFLSMDLVPGTMRNLLDVLSHLHRLEELDLVHGYISEGDSLDGLPVVHLPRLQELKICSAAMNIDVFLSHCTFPSTTITRFEIPVKQNGTFHYWGGAPPTWLQGEENWFLLQSVISKSIDIIQGYRPMTGLLVNIQSVADQADTAPNAKCQVTISSYHFDPASITRYIESSIPEPRFSVEFSYTGPLYASDLLRKLLLNLPLSKTIYLYVSCLPESKINNSAPDIGKFFSDLIKRCCPTGLEALHITGLSIDILPSMIKSWSWELYEDDIAGQESEICLDPHSNNPAARGLFGFVRTLILSGVRRSMHRRRISYSDFTKLCDVIRSQAKYYKGQCGPFTKLILQRCFIEREWLLDLADAVAELFNQQGRFTEDLPYEAYEYRRWSIPITPSVASPIPSPTLPTFPIIEPLPDKDLDWPLWDPQGEPPRPFQTGGDWVDHVRYGRVTFDFRGEPYIAVEQNLISVV
ncbi:hypothetical protein QCA50_006188 [Cerrena zonata]|uniref:F-box domain-containing protein n=1 Tax=Cerrena zonata TaxID=2478898 RepID=A0AAW0GIP1_9APHY